MNIKEIMKTDEFANLIAVLITISLCYSWWLVVNEVIEQAFG